MTIHLYIYLCAKMFWFIKWIWDFQNLLEVQYLIQLIKKISMTFKTFLAKVEKILKGSLDSIPSPLPSVKIQIIYWQESLFEVER